MESLSWIHGIVRGQHIIGKAPPATGSSPSLSVPAAQWILLSTSMSWVQASAHLINADLGRGAFIREAAL